MEADDPPKEEGQIEKSHCPFSLQMLLEYSGSSSEGSQLVKFLSHREAEVTLFVPHNAGFAPNQVK